MPSPRSRRRSWSTKSVGHRADNPRFGLSPLPPREAPEDQAQAIRVPDQPAPRGGARVGVLPLRHVGMSGDDSHLAPGLADEITTALSKFRWLFVVSSNSLSRTPGSSAMTQRSGANLDWISCWTVRCNGKAVTFASIFGCWIYGWTVRLCGHRRFDEDMSNLLALQDEVAAKVVAQIDPEILLIETRRISQPAACGCHGLRPDAAGHSADGADGARPVSAGGPTPGEGDRAGARICGGALLVCLLAYLPGGPGLGRSFDATMDRAGELAERAILLDPFDARGLAIKGHVSAFLHHRLDEAMLLHDRALSLNPNLPMAWALSAVAHAYAGDPEEAERRNNRYKQLSTFDPHAFFFDAFFILIHFMKRDYDNAVKEGRKVVQLNSSFSAGYKPYLAALGYLRQELEQETETIRHRLLAIEPDFTIERFLKTTPMKQEADRLHYAEGLRRAGIQEGVSQITTMPACGKHR